MSRSYEVDDYTAVIKPYMNGWYVSIERPHARSFGHPTTTYRSTLWGARRWCRRAIQRDLESANKGDGYRLKGGEV